MHIEIIKDLSKLKNTKKAEIYSRFFKTGPGEYGEGDVFWGITVPKQRQVAKKYYRKLSLDDIQALIINIVHEVRFTGLAMLVYKYKEADEKSQEEIAKFYLKQTKNINNWDLVDTSCPQILGDYFLQRDRSALFKLANSKNLWEKRIAVLATFTFIRHDDFTDAIKIFEILLTDTHDLIHKAIGWMLREMGKRGEKGIKAEKKFLNKYANVMPRTMLRYAIERFEEGERRKYLGYKQNI